MIPRRFRLLAVGSAAALVLAVSACSGGGAPQSNTDDGSGGGGGDSGYTIAMVTHETPGDSFWDKIRAGAEQAAKDTGSAAVLQRPGRRQAGRS